MAQFGNAQLDRVEVAVDSLETLVGEIKETDMASMGTALTQIMSKVDGIVWWSDYTLFSQSVNNGVPTSTTVWQNIVNVTGQGFLKECSYITEDLSGSLTIEVVVDGVVTWSKTLSVTADEVNILGLLMGELLSADKYYGPNISGAVVLNTITGVRVEYPSIVAPNNSYSILTEPIFFNESLIIRVKGNTARHYAMVVKGGVL